MGKKSRDKGARVERALVEELKRLGWVDVFRVPLSGAAKGFKGDVIAAPDQTSRAVNFECKSRATGFDKFYEFLLEFKTARVTDGVEDYVISLDLTEVMQRNVVYLNVSEFLEDKVKILNQIFNFKKKWLGQADVLVLKQDRKPFIYIKYNK